MDLAVQIEQIGQDDQSWLGSAHGTAMGRPITLDAALFVLATHFPNGYLPSGTAVAKFTATGRYGPYTTGAANGLQTLVGFTLTATKVTTTTSTPVAALFEHGRVVSARLPFQAGTGSVDATGQTQAAGRIIFI